MAANGAEEATEKLATYRAHNSRATIKSRQKLYDQAEDGDPEAIKRYEDYIQ